MARIALLLIAAHAAACIAGELHVSSSGSDEGRGTRERPFRTLERALNEVAKRPAATTDRGTTVWIAGGRYPLLQTLALGQEHSFTSLRARAREDVRLSGSRALPPAGFATLIGEQQARLDPAARGKVLTLNLKALGINDFGSIGLHGPDLYFNDRPLPLARWPNEGFASDMQVAGGERFVLHGIKGDHSGVFAYADNRPARWLREKDLWLHGYWFWDWADTHQRVEQIDPVQKLIYLGTPASASGYRNGARYYALNALSELDQPGEWYLDRSDGTLYLWPPGPLADARITLSTLDTPLVRLDGASAVVLHGLTIEGGRGIGVEIRGGKGNWLADCKVRNLGGDAIVVSGGHNHTIQGCEIEHVGGGAIVLAGGERTTLEPGNHAAVGNRIRDFSRVKRTYRPAVKLEGVRHRVQDNEIAEAPHMAIWFLGNDHLIERNEIRDVCRETGDAGAIYTGRDWTARGTVIRGNHIHGVMGVGQHGCQGIYLDDMASGIVVSANVVARARSGILAGGGRDNVIENNRISDCAESIFFDSRGLNSYQAMAGPGGALMQRLAQMPVDRPPWSTRYPQLAGILGDAPGAPKGNVIRGNNIQRCKPPTLAPEVIRFGTVHDNNTAKGR